MIQYGAQGLDPNLTSSLLLPVVLRCTRARPTTLFSNPLGLPSVQLFLTLILPSGAKSYSAFVHWQPTLKNCGILPISYHVPIYWSRSTESTVTRGSSISLLQEVLPANNNAAANAYNNFLILLDLTMKTSIRDESFQKSILLEKNIHFVLAIAKFELMLQEILQKAEEIIHRQMTEKFGLTQEESERSTMAFRDELNEFIQNSPLLKGNLLENAFSNLQQIKDSASFEEFKTKLAAALEEKAGLSPDMAASVRDFSISTFYQTFKEELTDEQGQIDLGKVVNKLNLGNLETTARELLGTFSQRFGGK